MFGGGDEHRMTSSGRAIQKSSHLVDSAEEKLDLEALQEKLTLLNFVSACQYSVCCVRKKQGKERDGNVGLNLQINPLLSRWF